MDDFLFAVNAVVPLFLVVAVGYFVRRVGVVDERFLESANQFCFRVAMPCLLFKNIYQPEVSEAYDPWILLLPVAGTLIAAGLAWLIVPRIVRERAQSGVVVQGIFRSNFLLFGLPLVINVFGPEAATPTSIVMAVIVPLFNILSVFVLISLGPRGPEPLRRSALMRSVLWGLVKNPYIIAVGVALLFAQIPLRLPGAATKVISDLAQIATPLMLVVLGGQFKIERVPVNRKPLLLTALNKLVVLPGVMLAAAVLLGIRGVHLAPVFGVFAAPTAVSSLAMASGMGGDGDLAGQIILITTLFSVLTIVGFVYLLRVLGFA